jgi:hypothetical protein
MPRHASIKIHEDPAIAETRVAKREKLRVLLSPTVPSGDFWCSAVMLGENWKLPCLVASGNLQRHERGINKGRSEAPA